MPVPVPQISHRVPRAQLQTHHRSRLRSSIDCAPWRICTTNPLACPSDHKPILPLLSSICPLSAFFTELTLFAVNCSSVERGRPPELDISFGVRHSTSSGFPTRHHTIILPATPSTTIALTSVRLFPDVSRNSPCCDNRLSHIRHATFIHIPPSLRRVTPN